MKNGERRTGKWVMEDGKWERRMENEKWKTRNFLCGIIQFLTVIIDIHILLFETFCAKIKRYDNGRSHPCFFISLSAEAKRVLKRILTNL